MPLLPSFPIIAIVGATGKVGQTLLKLLEARHFPAERLRLVASARSAGKKIIYLSRSLSVENLETFDFSICALAFFAAGSEVAKQYAPLAAQQACTVIDKSSYFRMDPAVPLVVPEVNKDILLRSKSKIFATPNCSTIPLVLALKPLHDLAGIERVDVATYQAVSGAGAAGIEELEAQMAFPMADYQAGQFSQISPKKFIAPIAFNVIPAIDSFLASGYTKEEMKMQEEACKILGADFVVNATAVRVPVWQGHSEAVCVKTRKPLSLEQAKAALAHCPSLQYLETDIPTPLTHATQYLQGWIGRVRRHPKDSDDYLNFWLVSDNLSKGAALNALDIALSFR